MASYGAKRLRWASFKAEAPDESAEAYPKYDQPVDLGKLVAVTDSITNAEAKLYADNALAETASEFQELGVDTEIDELSNEVGSKIFGAKLTEGQDLEYGAEDAAPYGGLGFIVSKMVKGKKLFQGVVYPKLKAAPQGVTYNTKGQSISFATGKIHFVGAPCKKGSYKVLSKDFTTQTEAETWVDNIIKVSV